MKHIKNTKIIVAMSLVVIAALVVTSLAVFNEGDRVLAMETSEQMHSSINELRSKLVPGTVLHVQRESFYRHGPASARINDISWMMPENVVADYYLGPVDKSGTYFSDYRSVIKNGNGDIVQTVNVIGDEIVYKDTRFGEINKRPAVSLGVNQYLQGFETTASLLLDKSWNYVESRASDAGEVLVFEQLVDYVPPPQIPETVLMDESNGVNVPYTLDLEPAKFLNRIEILSTNYLLHTSQTWIIDSSGKEILVREHKWSFFEVE